MTAEPEAILARWEAVGDQFSSWALQRARDLTVEAVARVGATIRPGLTEAQAHDLALQILAEMRMDRLWHKPVIRFGAGTLKTFSPPMDAERQLRERDIYYVDLGVVWGGHEGDAGDTFVVGDDREMSLCAAAARDIWKEVAASWARDGLTGPALYEVAVEEARSRGWRLNTQVNGHRIGDFPHHIHRPGALGKAPGVPSSDRWILEIQIRHPRRSFGAFYEDLLASPS